MISSSLTISFPLVKLTSNHSGFRNILTNKNPTSVTFPLPLFKGKNTPKHQLPATSVQEFSFVGICISINIDAYIFPTSTPSPHPSRIWPPTRKDQIPSSSGAGGPNHVGKLRARDQRLILDHPRKGERFQAEWSFIFVHHLMAGIHLHFIRHLRQTYGKPATLQ